MRKVTGEKLHSDSVPTSFAAGSDPGMRRDPGIA